MSNTPFISRPGHRSFLQKLRDAAEASHAAAAEDPWEPELRKLKGRIGHDAVERCSTAEIFDFLGIPMRRRPSFTVRLSRVMQKLGWTSIRARGLNRGSYLDRVRGYARQVPDGDLVTHDTISPSNPSMT